LRTTRTSDDRRPPRIANAHDVLWAEAGDLLDDFRGNGRELWDSKTQGCPYHLAMLAVGMLVESRSPRAAYVIGDIARDQAEQVKLWADALLEEPLELPVCVDPDRLYRRLFDLYGEEWLTIRRFSTLFRGSSSELWAAIVRHADRPAVRRWLAEGLGSVDLLRSGRAADAAFRYLEATGDVAGLIETVREIAWSRDRERETHSLETLLETLCSRSITIPPEERGVAPVERLPWPPESEPEEKLWEMLVRGEWSGPQADVYVPADELLEHFSQAEPHLRERFLETIRKSEQAAREHLRLVAQKLDELGRTDAPPESGRSPTDSPPTGERYIREEIAEQTPRYPDEEGLARKMGAGLREGLLASPAIAELTDREALLFALYRATRENDIVLTSPAWEAIDALADEEVLKHLLALAFLRQRELHFCDWRRYTLEHPRLWDSLAGKGGSEAPSR
jgi:hypothetical protein